MQINAESKISHVSIPHVSHWPSLARFASKISLTPPVVSAIPLAGVPDLYGIQGNQFQSIITNQWIEIVGLSLPRFKSCCCIGRHCCAPSNLSGWRFEQTITTLEELTNFDQLDLRFLDPSNENQLFKRELCQPSLRFCCQPDEMAQKCLAEAVRPEMTDWIQWLYKTTHHWPERLQMHQSEQSGNLRLDDPAWSSGCHASNWNSTQNCRCSWDGQWWSTWLLFDMFWIILIPFGSFWILLDGWLLDFMTPNFHHEAVGESADWALPPTSRRSARVAPAPRPKNPPPGPPPGPNGWPPDLRNSSDYRPPIRSWWAVVRAAPGITLNIGTGNKLFLKFEMQTLNVLDCFGAFVNCYKLPLHPKAMPEPIAAACHSHRPRWQWRSSHHSRRQFHESLDPLDLPTSPRFESKLPASWCGKKKLEKGIDRNTKPDQAKTSWPTPLIGGFVNHEQP